MVLAAADGWILLAAVAALAAFLPWVSRVRSRPVTGDPLCRRCGYVVRAITSGRCPECGADLYPGGIAYPGAFRPMPLRSRVELWSWAAGVLWCGLVGVDLLADGPADHARLGAASATLAAAWAAGMAVLLLRRRRRRRA
jgi:hypothetical protein